jgi:hypothetical protein
MPTKLFHGSFEHAFSEIEDQQGQLALFGQRSVSNARICNQGHCQYKVRQGCKVRLALVLRVSFSDGFASGVSYSLALLPIARLLSIWHSTLGRVG